MYRHSCGYRARVDSSVSDILNLTVLVEQLALALGLAMVLGNAYAIYRNQMGGKPKGEEGEFRRGRAYWLLGVGIIISVWGGVSILA